MIEVIIMLSQLLDMQLALKHGNKEKIERHEEINTNISTIEMVENTKSGEENKANKLGTEQSEAHWNMGNKPGTIRKRSRVISETYRVKVKKQTNGILRI